MYAACTEITLDYSKHVEDNLIGIN